jgi:hypothetical protein
MPDTVEIESALYFSLDQVAHKSRFASFLGSGATPQGLSLFCWKTDRERCFHKQT